MPVVVIGILGAFYLFFREFDFQLEIIDSTWAAVIAIILILVAGGVTIYVVERWPLLWARIYGSYNQARVRQNRYIMLENVENRWMKGGVNNSPLSNVELIKLDFELDSEAVENPLNISRSRDIREVFNTSERSLLILGELGSGKTTLLLQIAEYAMELAKRNDVLPIPVVFNLSSWTSVLQPISAWLVDELVTQYSVPREIAVNWTEDDAIFPLIDGLDMVAPERQEACVRAINHFRQNHLVPLVVCSRIDDYKALDIKLNLNAAISIKPLTSLQIDDYLSHFGDELLTARRILQGDEILMELARSPLMLNMISVAYKELTSEEIEELNTVDAHRQYLFGTYIQKRLAHQQRTRNYSLSQSIDWLSWLAQKMTEHSTGILVVEQMQSSWLSRDAMQIVYFIVSRMAVGLIFGAILTFSMGFWGGIFIGTLCGLFMGVLESLRSVFKIRVIRWLSFILLGILIQAMWPDNTDSSGLLLQLLCFAFLSVIGIGFVYWKSRIEARLYEREVERIRLKDEIDVYFRKDKTLSSYPNFIKRILKTLATESPIAYLIRKLFRRMTFLWNVILITSAIVFSIGNLNNFFDIVNVNKPSLFFSVIAFIAFFELKQQQQNKGDIYITFTLKWTLMNALGGMIKWLSLGAIGGAILGVVLGLSISFNYLLFTLLIDAFAYEEYSDQIMRQSLALYFPGVWFIMGISIFSLTLLFVWLSLPFGITFGGIQKIISDENQPEPQILSLVRATSVGVLSGIIAFFVLSLVITVFPLFLEANSFNENNLMLSLLLNEDVQSFLFRAKDFGAKEGLYFGLFAGGLAFLWYGGMDIIYSYILRSLLCLDGEIPRNYKQFLGFACQRTILQTIGNGYMFIHPLLMEQFTLNYYLGHLETDYQ